jgi:hypothetical protein
MPQDPLFFHQEVFLYPLSLKKPSKTILKTARPPASFQG